MRFHFKNFLKDQNTGRPPTTSKIKQPDTKLAEMMKMAEVSNPNFSSSTAFSRDNTRCKRSRSYHFAPKIPQNVNKQISTDSAYSATANTTSSNGGCSSSGTASPESMTKHSSSKNSNMQSSNSVQHSNSSTSSNSEIRRSNSSRESTSVSRSNSASSSLMRMYQKGSKHAIFNS